MRFKVGVISNLWHEMDLVWDCINYSKVIGFVSAQPAFTEGKMSSIYHGETRD